MNADVIIRFAETPEEREAVCRHRYRVYTEEMRLYQAQADHERKMLADAHDATGRLLFASVDGEVVGSLRIHVGSAQSLPPAFVTVYDLSRFEATAKLAVVTRFVVDARHRGGTASFNLMTGCCEFLFGENASLVFIACAPHLINLYLAFGFRTYTKNFNDPDVGFVVPMMLQAGDPEHLKAMRSPLLPWLSRPSGPRPAAPAAIPVDSTVRSEHLQPEEYWSQVYRLLNEQSHGHHHVFAGLSDEQTNLLLSKGHLIECSQGELIIKKGALSSSLFIIMSGAVEVRDGDRVLAVLGSGDVLGEIAFLLAAPRSADVYAASEHVKILSTDEKTLRQLIDLNPTVSAKFLLNLAKTLCIRLVGLQAHATAPAASSASGGTP